ncbi:hypothetical protein A1O1_03568 [Capronia coronata CBS 617.96]|uniref:TRIP4/RQT4 C2HC5-type zinc finger domain-containing protein n=1 Tax=Capronia coronata CBS 617.96 TaxID=1182541 RepID=W9YLC2_9EURO|nr:uncharacterized protein A1O1_03568 [Capronia coronata CBS 617.96]EXJ90465.1 hypothetical protein A1O1_03568 [Capronia coronata CBS 617.96]
MSGDVQSWALPRLQRLLPIDDGSLKEIVTYTCSLSKPAAADHLKNLLGDSPQALEFISSFNARRSNVPPEQASSLATGTSDGAASPRKKATKKSKPPLHSTGPARRPEGYGNVTGGYKKHYDDENYSSSTPRPSSQDRNIPFLSSAPEARQAPHTTAGIVSGSTSRDASPAKSSHKLPPSASGQLISDFGFANVRAKQSKKPAHPTHSQAQSQSGASTPNKGGVTMTTTTSVADLTSAIAALELATNPTLSTKRRRCDCNASIHPLFTTAPNCINCGKIICAFEGLQPCSFCDSPLLSKDQVNDMIKALKEERGIEKMAAHNAAQSQSGKGTPVFGGSTPDSASGDELSSAASRARAHRDKLLAFQRENAQRTRVYDEAADYDMSLTPGATQWMSPVQRAAALKKQQKYLRELEEANRPEWEKKRTVMSMSIRNGKLVRTYGREKAPSSEDKEDSVHADEDDGDEHEGDDEHQHLSIGGKGAFSNNPLLATGKLIRPIWKAPEQTSEGKSAESDGHVPRKSVWRRVQDDNEDNEQWILDGGLHGYGTESRLMEDGSQQECG